MNVPPIYLEAVGIVAPGLSGADARGAVACDAEWEPTDNWSATPECLSPRQAKRLSPTTRLALSCAEQIGPVLPDDAGWVYASSIGEGVTLDVILQALSEDEILISPMKFQNAVHNAAVGQWTIAKTLKGPSTSIAAYDETAGAGLLKAMLQCALEQRPVGLVIYDWPLPPPLHEKRPIEVPVAVGFAFSPVKTPTSSCKVTCAPGAGDLTPACSAPGIRLCMTGNPAAAALPLLEVVLTDRIGSVTLGLSGGGRLSISVTAP